MHYCPLPALAACRSSRQRGFTLIELLVILAIIGIIAAVAYPNYSQYVERATRSDGQAGLLEAAAEMERCYSKNYSYSSCVLSNSQSPEGNYAITPDTSGAVSDGGYTLTATLVNGRQDDGCKDGNLTLNAKGAKLPEQCW